MTGRKLCELFWVWCLGAEDAPPAIAVSGDTGEVALSGKMALSD